MEKFSVTCHYTDMQIPIIKCERLSLSIYVHQTKTTFKESETNYEAIYLTPLDQKFTRYYVITNANKANTLRNWDEQLIYDMINYYNTVVLKCEMVSVEKNIKLIASFGR